MSDSENCNAACKGLRAVLVQQMRVIDKAIRGIEAKAKTSPKAQARIRQLEKKIERKINRKLTRKLKAKTDRVKSLRKTMVDQFRRVTMMCTASSII